MRRHGAWLLVDEAHSFGVFGARGLGLCEELGLLDEVDFIVGTFSKSLGGVGGFCLSRHAELELARMVSRPYIFTASPAPPVIAATHQALRMVLAGDALRARLRGHAEHVYAEVARLGYRLGTDTPGPVVALVFDARDAALALWQGLLDAGIYTNLMIPPATPGRPQPGAHQPERGAQRRRHRAHRRRARRAGAPAAAGDRGLSAARSPARPRAYSGSGR